MKKLNLLFLMIIVLSCTIKSKKDFEMPYQKNDFERIIEGKPTRLFILENKNGMTVALTNYGAKIVSIYVPDKKGEFADVVLGFRSIADYLQYSGSHGAVVGPFANRISNARFSIGNEVYSLPVNNGQACIHSGPDSWYRKVWDASKNDNVTVFELESRDGEFGFPGNKKVKVSYTLTDDNELKIDYEVTTDKACHLNLTNHSYFNLKGEGNGDILDHVIEINANQSTPVSNTAMIPTGEIVDIRGTDLDFTSPRVIGDRINNKHDQLQFASGYDFNYVLNKKEAELAFAASAFDPVSGRFMEVFTTEPGIQFYTGNHLKGTEIGKSGKGYGKREGFCLETQHFPDSPNQPNFPSTLLQPGDTLLSTTIFKFSTR